MITSVARGRQLLLAAVLSLPVVLAAACGGSDAPPAGETAEPPPASAGRSSPAEPSRPPFPVTVAADNGAVTVAQRPGRIVSLSPTATEMLFAIGAGDLVVAVDDQSDHPPGVPSTELSGFEPNVEAVVGHDPDLVIVSSVPGDVVAGLDAVGVTVIVHDPAASLDDAYTQIEQLGAVTGHVADAAELVARMRSDIEQIVAQADGRGEGLSYYHELDTTLFSVSSATFLGDVYGRLGLVSIADQAAARAGSDYPQLSSEFVVEADPDLILLADVDCCGVRAETVAARPGWEQIAAVRTGAIVELDDDVASRWGPRIVQLLQQAAGALGAARTVER